MFLCAVNYLRAAEPCVIEVVEKGSGWPVSLVELRTTNQLRYVTDNAGVIVVDAPELMGRETWFTIFGHGYDVPTDGFEQRGVRLTPQPGKTLKVEVRRGIIAKRLSSPPPSIGLVRPGLPAHVAVALNRALAQAPADRFPTAAA